MTIQSSVPNKIVDQNGNIFPSIRNLAKTIHVKRERISKAIKEKGYFTNNGIMYSGINDDTKLHVVTF